MGRRPGTREWADPAMGIPDPAEGRVGDTATATTASTAATFMAAAVCCERERELGSGRER